MDFNSVGDKSTRLPGFSQAKHANCDWPFTLSAACHVELRPPRTLCPALSVQEVAEAAAEAPMSVAAKPGADAAASRGGALLFVHGAAIKFEQAIRRTSQMKVGRGSGLDLLRRTRVRCSVLDRTIDLDVTHRSSHQLIRTAVFLCA